MGKTLARFLFDRPGVTGIEYGLLAFGISLALVAALHTVGEDLKLSLKLVAALKSTGPHLGH